jgi:uncharacterized repeat protein (TIGR03803 family)
MSPTGTLIVLYSFSGQTDGIAPNGLVLGTDGNFYGTTAELGSNNGGTVFKVTPRGTLTTLHSFCAQTNCADGSGPRASLIQASDGNFYGTTVGGGSGTACTNGCGTVFKITPRGTLTTLHSFDFTDGEFPLAGLIQATDGNLYGTSSGGGAGGYGTVFKITLQGTLTTLQSFDLTDGARPLAPLVQAVNGNFFGTTSDEFLTGNGTIFAITPRGALITLHSFSGSDGMDPYAGLIQATDGNFYGTTVGGGSGTACTNRCGTLFKITPGGILTTLHSFDLTDGEFPSAGLVQATNGSFYGVTQAGGSDDSCSFAGLVGCGTAFALSVGLGTFVETLPTSGKIGGTVRILGNGLTGATSVTFNGVAATFKVVSASEISTSVPSGASTGKVEVTTPSGTLTSNVPFVVRP